VLPEKSAEATQALNWEFTNEAGMFCDFNRLGSAAPPPIPVSMGGGQSGRLLLARGGTTYRFRQAALTFLAAVLLLTFRPAPAAGADHEVAQKLLSQANDLYDQGQFAQAVAGYDKAIAADSQYAEAYYNRALAEEMVDRGKAIEDWQQFVNVAGDRPEFKWDVARIQARAQLLKDKPPLPEAMQPSHYVAEAGDYYRAVGVGSEGEQWPQLPVKVFLGSAPNIKWQEGARQAFDIWRGLFPMQLLASPENADIRIGWDEFTDMEDAAGEEEDWVITKHTRNHGRVAVITVDLSRPWSQDEMRAIMLHEFGHALGIKGHSESKKDIMYFYMQEHTHEVRSRRLPVALFWKTLVKNPSQRDINTLIRLYNSAGTIARFN
jgi:predicted Zn-dependent protease